MALWLVGTALVFRRRPWFAAAQLAGVEGDSFAPDGEGLSGNPPQVTIAMTGGKGEEWILHATYRPDTKDFLVALEGSATAFILSDWGIRAKTRKLSEYEPEAPASAPW